MHQSEATHTVELFFANVTSITLPSTPEPLTVINSWGAIVQNYTTKILGENEDIQSVAAKIRSFETCVQVLVAYAQASEGDLQAVLGGDAASSARFLEELAVAYQSLAVDIGIDASLPLAVRTVSPEQRRIMTKNILIQAERVSLDLAAQHGVPQEQSQSLQSYFHNLGSYVEMLVSITGKCFSPQFSNMFADCVQRGCSREPSCSLRSIHVHCWSAIRSSARSSSILKTSSEPYWLCSASNRR